METATAAAGVALAGHWTHMRQELPCLAANLSCFLCHNTLDNPFSITVCAHSFCKECIFPVLGSESACPVCKQPAFLKDLVPNRPLSTISCCLTQIFSLLRGESAEKSKAKIDKDVQAEGHRMEVVASDRPPTADARDGLFSRSAASIVATSHAGDETPRKKQPVKRSRSANFDLGEIKLSDAAAQDASTATPPRAMKPEAKSHSTGKLAAANKRFKVYADENEPEQKKSSPKRSGSDQAKKQKSATDGKGHGNGIFAKSGDSSVMKTYVSAKGASKRAQRFILDDDDDDKNEDDDINDDKDDDRTKVHEATNVFDVAEERIKSSVGSSNDNDNEPREDDDDDDDDDADDCVPLARLMDRTCSFAEARKSKKKQSSSRVSAPATPKRSETSRLQDSPLGASGPKGVSKPAKEKASCQIGIIQTLKQWSCAQCTFMNGSVAKKCSMCGKPKRIKAQAARHMSDAETGLILSDAKRKSASPSPSLALSSALTKEARERQAICIGDDENCMHLDDDAPEDKENKKPESIKGKETDHNSISVPRVTKDSSFGSISSSRSSSSLSHSIDSQSNMAAALEVKAPPIVLVATGLLAPQKKRLTSMLSKCMFGGRTARAAADIDANTTHVITSTDATGLCPRTLKYMHGILEGIWIVRFEWLEKSIARGEWLHEEAFEVVGDAVCGPTFGPKLGRQNAKAKGQKLFHDISIFFEGDVALVGPSKSDLTKLVKSGGGKVLTRRPSIKIDAKTADRSAGAVPHVHVAAEEATSASLDDFECAKQPSGASSSSSSSDLLPKSSPQAERIPIQSEPLFIFDPANPLFETAMREGSCPNAFSSSWLLNCVSSFSIPPRPVAKPPSA